MCPVSWHLVTSSRTRDYPCPHVRSSQYSECRGIWELGSLPVPSQAVLCDHQVAGIYLSCFALEKFPLLSGWCPFSFNIYFKHLVFVRCLFISLQCYLIFRYFHAKSLLGNNVIKTWNFWMFSLCVLMHSLMWTSEVSRRCLAQCLRCCLQCLHPISKCPHFEFMIHFQLQLTVNVHGGRQQVKAEV